MEKKTAVLATEDDLIVDLTLHNVPASLLTEFAQKIVRPYYERQHERFSPRPLDQSAGGARLRSAR